MYNFTMFYDNNDGLAVASDVDEDATLTEIFARFIDMTRIMGYQAGSWDNIIKELQTAEVNAKDYDIFEWAMDVIY